MNSASPKVVKRLLFVDPGKRIGVCAVTIFQGYDYMTEYAVLRKEFDEDMLKLASYVLGSDTVVVENFILDHRAPFLKGDVLYAPEVIGAIEGWLLMDKRRNTLVRVTNQVKGRLPKEVIRAVIGELVTRRHAADAAAIAAWWLLQEEKNPVATQRAREAYEKDS